MMKKPRVRQSNLVKYAECNYSYKLATKLDFKQSMPMREGCLFEGYVFGFKDNNESELIGSKKERTIDALKAKSLYVNELFVKGESYVKMEHEHSQFILTGELDYVGIIKYNDPIKGSVNIKCIADLKLTGDMKIWEQKLDDPAPHKFLQSIAYPYLHYKKYGEILPFIYIVVEDKYSTPLIKQIMVTPSEKGFRWFEKFIIGVINDKNPRPNPHACYRSLFNTYRCPYMYACEFGKKSLSQTIEMNFAEDLLDFELFEENK